MTALHSIFLPFQWANGLTLPENWHFIALVSSYISEQVQWIGWWWTQNNKWNMIYIVVILKPKIIFLQNILMYFKDSLSLNLILLVNSHLTQYAEIMLLFFL
jgi:hypothetical protein